MLRPAPLVLLAALLVGCGPASSQAPADDDARKDQLVANLMHEYPQLEGSTVTVDSLQASGVEGFDRGLFLLGGSSAQPFLVATDNSVLYLLASEGIDVSRSPDELAALRETETAAEAAAAAERATALLTAVQGLPSKGPADAPVTIVEFSDFECSFCKRASATVEQVLAAYPEDVRIVYAHYPLDFHPWAEPAAIAASCAAQQDVGAFWTLHDAYFANQSAISPQNVMARSRETLANTGIDMAAWSTCAEDETSTAYLGVKTAVQSQMELGSEYGVSGTPAFFINGRFVNGAQPMEAFVEAIEAAKAAVQG